MDTEGKADLLKRVREGAPFTVTVTVKQVAPPGDVANQDARAFEATAEFQVEGAEHPVRPAQVLGQDPAIAYAGAAAAVTTYLERVQLSALLTGVADALDEDA